MKHISESIIGRKSTSPLYFLRSLPGDDRFSENRIYSVMDELFHHDGATMKKDPRSPQGFKKVYKNPSKLIRTLGDWCAPKETFVTYNEPLDYFGVGRIINFTTIEYVFQGGDEPFDYDSLASAISDGLSVIPGYNKSPIIIFPHVRDGINPGDPIYIANPLRPKDPIRVNDVIGNDKAWDLMEFIYEL